MRGIDRRDFVYVLYLGWMWLSMEYYSYMCALLRKRDVAEVLDAPERQDGLLWYGGMSRLYLTWRCILDMQSRNLII